MKIQTLVLLLALTNMTYADESPSAPTCLSSASVITLTQDDVKAINEEISKLLTPYNDNLTQAELTFSRISTNEKRAVDVQVGSRFSKTGAAGSLRANINNLEYTYPDQQGCAQLPPRLQLDFDAAFNLLNFMTQEEINKMGSSLEKEFLNLIMDFVRDYGDAAQIDAKITKKNLDDKGNLTALGAYIDISIDKTRLPKDFDMNRMYFIHIKLEPEITLQSLKLKADVVINPETNAFKYDEKGLKEYLEKIKARDPETLHEIAAYIRFVDDLAKDVINKKPEPQP